MREKDFSIGEYIVGPASRRAVLPFAYPIIAADGRLQGIVAVSLDLEKYGRSFLATTSFPKGSTINILDRNHIRLSRHSEQERHAGKVDLPDMVCHMSLGPPEGVFIATGVDGVRRLFAYRRFSLQDGASPYLFMPVGVPEKLTLAASRENLVRNIALLTGCVLAVMLAALLVANKLIVRRLNRLVERSRQLGRGDFTVCAGIDYREEELGKGDRIYALSFYGEKRPLLIDYIFDPQLSRQDNYNNFHRDGDVISAEGYVPFPGKEGRFLWAKAGPIYDGVGKVIGAIEILRNITDERRLEEELRESEARFRMVIQHSGAVIAAVDLKGKFILVNPAMVEMLGYSEEELLRMDFQQVSHPDDIAEEIEKVVRLLKGEIEGYRQEKRYIHKDGRILWAMFTATLVRDRQGKPHYFIGQAQDITDRVRAVETIRQMAYHDPLTGLPNRKLLADRMQMAQARAKRHGHLDAVAYLDLDGFKEVNDVHGHDIGDLLLREAAGRIPGVLRQGDTMARVGGDEFVLVLPEIKDKSDVTAIAGKVMNCLRRPFLIGTHEIIITTSLGITFYPDDGEEQEILLRNADDAMYQAKQAGKNTFRYYQ